VNGLIVIDGLMGDYFDTTYGLLSKNPVTLEVIDSRIVKVHCIDTSITDDLMNYMKQDANANRIGEFAIGCNTGLDKLYGQMLVDEKRPGVHVAIGHGYPEVTGSGWSSLAHCDCVMLETTVIVDGEILMEKGKFLKLD
jgi:aminopeptidase